MTEPAEFRDRMRRVWGGADYPALAERLAPAAHDLVDALAPGPADRVLDVAAGTGSAAALARERGAAVVATDLAPRMVELGRAATAGTGVVWLEADAEALPLPDGAAEVVQSSFGLIFAPRPEVALAEARRVLVPGGRLGFTAWTPDGFMGRMTAAMLPHTGAPPGLPDQMDWARPDVVRDRLTAAGFGEVTLTERALPWHFDSPADMTAFFRAHSPAHAAAAAGLGEERAAAMFADIEAMTGPPGEPVRLDAAYLVVTATD
ncbi:class I SAM-dependent methyltransferase [Pseudonocardia phyllosphaerae]|uniref:class I SAM-dependent methyltransferase n=1 Tax=Pseudonocardia phyllosphaerae TaxID=3390502 RepID=UPI003978F637